MAGPLSLRLLGGFEAHFATGPAPPLAKKTQALLAYLALEGGSTRPRAELATLLWGDTGDEQALQSLRKALSGLRQALGPAAESVLVIQDGTIGLNLAVLVVDALDFERQARANAPSDLAEAVALYQGHLLAGLDIDEAPFNEWLLSKRERLRELALNTLGRLLDHQIGAGALDAAIDTASRVLALEPLHEPAHRALIQIYGKQGRRSVAARQYQLCVETLARELGVKPEPATEEAYRDSLAAQPPGATAPLAAPVAPSLAPPPIVVAAIALPRRRSAIAIGAVLVGVIAALVGYSYWSSRSPSVPPGPRRSVAILAMKNLSGQAEHAWLSTALIETIGAELAASGQFRLVSAENLSRVQLALTPPQGLGLSRKQLDEIGRDLGSDLILSGNYLVVGSSVRVDVRLDDVATGEPVANTSVTDQEAGLLALVDRVGDDLRARMGLAPTGSRQRDEIRASFPTTPTARRLYFLGLDALRLRDGPKAAELLQQAIDAEPRLALAHAALSTTWKLLGYDGRAASEAKTALDLSERLSAEDRLNVEAHYQEASFNWAKAVEGYQRLCAAYPDNIEYALRLGDALQIAGRFKEAAVVIDQTRKLPGADGADPRIDLLDATVSEKSTDYPRALAASGRAADRALAIRATLLLARARLKQGIYLSRLKQPDKALERMAESRGLFESLGDQGGVADALRWEGNILAFDLHRLDDSDAKFATALELSRPLRYVRLTTEILMQQSFVARERGFLLAARAPAEAALVSAREADEPGALSRSLNLLASVLRPPGEFGRARALYSESLPILLRLGDMPVANATRNNIAFIDYLQGRIAEARAAFESLLADNRKADNKAGIALRLSNLGLLHTMRGDLAQAETLTSEACKVNEGLANKPAFATCRVRLALLWIDLGRTADARKLLDQIAVADLSAAPQAPVELARIAKAYLDTGQRPKAASAIAEARRLLAKQEYIPDQVITVEIANARLEAATGSTPAALARLAKAGQDADRFGLVLLSMESRLLAATLDVGPARRAAIEKIERDARTAGLGYFHSS